jgi:ferredoxin
VGGRSGPGPSGPARGVPVKIRIDSDKCQGHARCFALAPELFAVDDYGQASVLVDQVPPELVDRANLAIANCPEYAIESLGD